MPRDREQEPRCWTIKSQAERRDRGQTEKSWLLFEGIDTFLYDLTRKSKNRKIEPMHFKVFTSLATLFTSPSSFCRAYMAASEDLGFVELPSKGIHHEYTHSDLKARGTDMGADGRLILVRGSQTLSLRNYLASCCQGTEHCYVPKNTFHLYILA